MEYSGAFCNALALEATCMDGITYDPVTKCTTFKDTETLIRYAAIVAYKTAHNIRNGHELNEMQSPLK